MKEGISTEEFKDILMKLNRSPHEMIRTQEAEYKNNYKGRNFTDDEWIKIMTQNPRLIKRPIVIKEYKAVWADPPDNMEGLFE